MSWSSEYLFCTVDVVTLYRVIFNLFFPYKSAADIRHTNIYVNRIEKKYFNDKIAELSNYVLLLLQIIAEFIFYLSHFYLFLSTARFRLIFIN